MRTVQDILKSKPTTFNRIHPETTVFEALNYLNSLNASYLVVMDNNQYCGLFTERDYSRKVILKGLESKFTTVAEVMTTDLPIVELTDTVDHCMHLMHLHRVRYLLAFYPDGQRLGVITMRDLLKEVIKEKPEEFNIRLPQDAAKTIRG
jgi:signal-transduction protein with cAMP-binding, CBS, and nucleotidyltransferase domain